MMIAFALGILIVPSRRTRPQETKGNHLDAASGAAGESAVGGLDGLVVATEEVMRPAQTIRCQQAASVEAERATALPPLLCPLTPKCFRAYGTVDIARIDLKRVADLPEREIVSSFVHVDKCEQAVGACRRRIERQGFLRERHGLLKLFLTKFRPSRNEDLEMRAAERGVCCGIVRVEVDPAPTGVRLLKPLMPCATCCSLLTTRRSSCCSTGCI